MGEPLQPTLMGILHAIKVHHDGIFSFEYDKNWLKNNQASAIDPTLQLLEGRQYASSGQDSFGAFLDSSPDR